MKKLPIYYKITLSHVSLGGEDDRLKPIVTVFNAFALTDIHYLGENLGIAKLQECRMMMWRYKSQVIYQ